jgi:hypothetical protein
VLPKDNTSADVEAAKREAEQARIRANQLENELKKLAEKEAAGSCSTKTIRGKRGVQNAVRTDSSSP